MKTKIRQRKPVVPVKRRPSVVAKAKTRNPAAAATAAARVFREWHDFEPRAVTRRPMHLQLGKHLVCLGDLVAVVYASDKWGPGKKKKYIHYFTRGKLSPLYYDPKTNMLVIPGPPVAGAWKITADGIVG